MSEKPLKPYSAGPPDRVAAGSEVAGERQIKMATDVLAWAEVHNLIVRSILANEGHHFHNCDQGHPAYKHGAETGNADPYCDDGPETNGIYRLLLQTSEQLGHLVERRITNWREFCQLAIEGYDRSFER